MTIIHNSELGKFSYLDEDNQEIGKLFYRQIDERKIDAFSTQVAPQAQGKGVAGELYKALIAFAQEHHLKIKPSCSYIAVKMQREQSELMV